MYSDQLRYPHEELTESAHELRASLDEALQTEQVRLALDELKHQDPDTYGEAVLYAAGWAQQTVRRTLRYERGTHLDDLPEKQSTNCIGYTLVGSETLERLGVDHYVGYVNGHALLMVPTERQGKQELWMLDMLSPQLNQEVTPALMRSDAATIARGIKDEGRAAALLNSSELVKGLDQDFEALAKKHPWLSGENLHAKAPNWDWASERRAESSYRKRHQLVLSVFEPEEGRRGLAEYVHFNEALGRGDDTAAAQSLQAMEGAYPELDARQFPGRKFKRLVKRLCRQGEVDQAQGTVEALSSSFRFSEDSRFAEFTGDCWRYIAETTGDPQAAATARANYQKAQTQPKAYKSIGSKVQLLDNLALEAAPTS